MYLWKSLHIAAEIRGVPILLEVPVGIAGLRSKKVEKQSAFQLLLIALNDPVCDQETKNRAEKLRAELETQLTPTQIEAIQAHAGEKTFESVVEELLS